MLKYKVANPPKRFSSVYSESFNTATPQHPHTKLIEISPPKLPSPVLYSLPTVSTMEMSLSKMETATSRQSSTGSSDSTPSTAATNSTQISDDFVNDALLGFLCRCLKIRDKNHHPFSTLLELQQKGRLTKVEYHDRGQVAGTWMAGVSIQCGENGHHFGVECVAGSKKAAKTKAAEDVIEKVLMCMSSSRDGRATLTCQHTRSDRQPRLQQNSLPSRQCTKSYQQPCLKRTHLLSRQCTKSYQQSCPKRTHLLSSHCPSWPVISRAFEKADKGPC